MNMNLENITPIIPIESETSSKNQTRNALIKAAIGVFSRDGGAASTRAIADAAGVNQALINYHFKTKHGLYLATFNYIDEFMQKRLGNTLKEIEERLTSNTELETSFYWQALRQLLGGMLHMINSSETKEWASLIIREQQHPTDAFSILENGTHGRLRVLLTRLVERQLGLDEYSEEAKLISLTLMGQILMFKIGRATVLACTGWESITPEELKKIECTVFRNFAKILNVENI